MPPWWVLVPGEDLVADVVLNERQGPAGRGVVGVGDAARPVHPGVEVVPDHAVSDAADQAADGRPVDGAAWVDMGTPYAVSMSAA